jgi:hypothetical protein
MAMHLASRYGPAAWRHFVNLVAAHERLPEHTVCWFSSLPTRSYDVRLALTLAECGRNTGDPRLRTGQGDV